MVKRKGNLISSLCRMDNILLAGTNARKAKRRSRRFIEKHDKNILEGSIPQDEMDTEANAITISAYGASLVAVNSRRGSSIVHEAEHIKNHIWQYIGYTPQRDNDEVDAYLLTYIYDKITQVFYKHKDNKE